jgi:Family of unknown function (DUF6526)
MDHGGHVKEQSYSNHVRWFPLFHFVVSPILLAYAIWAIWVAFVSPGADRIWTAVFAVGVFLGALASRAMAVTVQDRVIRLEMRLRLAAVLPDDLRPHILSLTPRHLVALRFASDAELPELVRQVVSGKLGDSKAIKMAIVRWQADHLRA